MAKAGKAWCALDSCVDRNGRKRKVWVCIEGNRELYSIFCRRHGCAALTRQQSGDDRTDWTVCEAVRPEDTRYCKIHDVCNKYGCLKKRDTSFNNHKDRPLCSDHKCLNGTCKNERSDNSGYCETHRAICHKMPGCGNKVIENGDFCVQHTCQQKLCLDFTASRWCDDHTPCHAPGCINPKVGRGDGPYAHPYCADHVPKPCAAHQGHQREVLAPPGEIFCDRHRCREHGCSEQRAEQEAIGYCKTHKCGDPKCPQPISHSEAVASTYCHNHECAYSDDNGLCRKLKGERDSSCKEHVCGYNGCPTMMSLGLVKLGQKRCEKHTDEIVALKEEIAALKKQKANEDKQKTEDEAKRRADELKQAKKIEWDNIVEERDKLLKERNEILQEKDKALKELDVALREKDNALEDKYQTLDKSGKDLKEKNKALAQRDTLKKKLDELLKQQREEAERYRKVKEEAERAKASANEATIKNLREEIDRLTKELEAQKAATVLPEIRLPDNDTLRNLEIGHMGLGYGLSVARGPPTESGYGGSDTHTIAIPTGTKKFTLEMGETDEGPAVDRRAKVEGKGQQRAS